MCRFIYLASPSNAQLTTGAISHPCRRTLHLSQAIQPPALVQQILGSRNIYQLDSAEGCGCAFSGEFEPHLDAEEVKELELMMTVLSETLADLTDTAGELLLYTDWDFEIAPARPQRVTAREVAHLRFGDGPTLLY